MGSVFTVSLICGLKIAKEKNVESKILKEKNREKGISMMYLPEVATRGSQRPCYVLFCLSIHSMVSGSLGWPVLVRHGENTFSFFPLLPCYV